MRCIINHDGKHPETSVYSMSARLLILWLKQLLKNGRISHDVLDNRPCNVKRLEVIQDDNFSHGIATSELNKFCYLFHSPFTAEILNFSQSLDFLHLSFLSPIFVEVKEKKHDQENSDGESEDLINYEMYGDELNEWKTAFNNLMSQTLLKQVKNVTECQINIQLHTYHANTRLILDADANNNIHQEDGKFTLENYAYTIDQWFVMTQHHLLQWALILHKKTEYKKHGMKLKFMITFGTPQGFCHEEQLREILNNT